MAVRGRHRRSDGRTWRCLHGLAEVAERRGDLAVAMMLLDRAAALFQQHGAVLYVRQVLAKKDILKA